MNLNPKMLSRINREKKWVEEDENKQEIVLWEVDEKVKDPKIVIKFEGPELYGLAYMQLEFIITIDYPMKPPKCRFLDPIPFHPNVQTNGNICIDSLQHNWTPALKLNNLVLTIFCLLTDPNPSSPANIDAGTLMRKNFKEYSKKCVGSMKGGDRMKEVKKDEAPKGKGKGKKEAVPEANDVLFKSNNDEENNKLDLKALGISEAEQQQQLAQMRAIEGNKAIKKNQISKPLKKAEPEPEEEEEEEAVPEKNYPTRNKGKTNNKKVKRK